MGDRHNVARHLRIEHSDATEEVTDGVRDRAGDGEGRRAVQQDQVPTESHLVQLSLGVLDLEVVVRGGTELQRQQGGIDVIVASGGGGDDVGEIAHFFAPWQMGMSRPFSDTLRNPSSLCLSKYVEPVRPDITFEAR